jgi:hypothetical protein
MIEGTGEAVATVEVATAFAFLADPRNGRLWFASAEFLEPPEGPLSEGLTWRLEKTRETRRVLPLCLVTYQPPERFVWATQLRGLATNNIWELRFQPGEETGTTRLTMTLRLQLSPLGWLSMRIAPSGLRRTLDRRAQRALDRACEVLEAQQIAGKRSTAGGGKRTGKSSKRGRKRR